MQPAVADQADDFGAGRADGRTHGSAGAVAQGTIAGGGVEEAARAVVVIVKVGGIDRLGAVAHDQAAGQGGAHHLDHGQAVWHQGVKLGQLSAGLVAGGGGAGRAAAVLGGQVLQKRRHGGPGITVERQGCGQAGKLVGAGVDTDHVGPRGQIAYNIHVIIGPAEFGADGQHAGGGVDQVAHRGQAGRGRHGQGVVMHQPARVNGLDDRGIQPLGQRPQGGLLPAGAAAGKDHHIGGGIQKLGRLFKAFGRGADRQGGGCGQGRALHRHHVRGHFDMDGAGAAGGHGGKGPIQGFGDVRRVGDAPRGAKRGNHCLLVGQFVQKAPALAQGPPPIDARDHQHGDRIFARLGHGGDGIRQAGAGDDQGNAGLAGGAGIAIGHERAALFVPRRHMAHRAAGQSAIHFNGMHARDSKDHLNPTGMQPFDQSHADGVHLGAPMVLAAKAAMRVQAASIAGSG